MSYLELARTDRISHRQQGEASAVRELSPGAAISDDVAATALLAQAEAEYERLYWGRIIPLGDARRAAVARGDHAEAARLEAEKGALAAGEYTDARRRYLALVERIVRATGGS